MKTLQQFSLILFIGIISWACSPTLDKKKQTKEEPVVIANDSLEYEIIIMDIGFNSFLNSVAQPRGFYGLQYLENKNRIYVSNWNMIANNPTAYNNLQFNPINYENNISYGYEVNYLLFNYFEFAQRKYRVNLLNGTSRIRKRGY